MTKTPMIIDCDPGQDDAMMLFLALNAPEFDIRGIVAVAGNVPLSKTARNLAMIADIAEVSEIPLFAGCERPMVRELVTAEYVHGKTGINGIEVFEPENNMQDEHGVDYIVRELKTSERPVTIVATGPLTNVAMALVRAPEIAKNIKEIVIMGGASFEAGNVTPSAEFNIYVDPHAADVVLKSGCRQIWFGLDVTHKVMTLPERVQAIRNSGSKVGEVSANLLEYYDRYDKEKYGSDGGPLHDPCTIAWLLKPELFKLKSCHIAVECASELTMGHTAVDFWGVTGETKNAQWAYDVDDDGFFELLSERIANYA